MRTDTLRCGLLISAIAVSTLGSAAAQDAAQPRIAGDAPTAAESAVRKATADYQAAIQKRDLDAIAAFWTPSADFVDQSGRVYKVHAGVERAKRGAQEEAHLAHLCPRTETLDVRLVTPDVAIEDGSFHRSNPASGQTPFGRYSAVWVKRDGRWLIDGLRESSVHLENSSEALAGLAWMVGDWVAENPQVTAEINCTWGQDHSYILAQLKLQPQGGEPITGTQLIGWDPLRQRVHSFLLDSRGGYTEGIWTDEGDAWTVKANSVLPNGARVASTRLYSHIDDNTVLWESIEDEHDGQPGTDIRLRMTRKKTAK